MNKRKFDGLNCSPSTMHLLSDAQTRSISSENRSGAKSGGGRAEVPIDADGAPTGAARELGLGWKVKAYDIIEPGETFIMADIDGPGSIQQIWLTLGGSTAHRHSIIRIYYDNQEDPSVECPIGDFFASAYSQSAGFAQVNSLMICVNPGNAFNCYWPMPFRKHIKITVENISTNVEDKLTLYYQVNYALNDVSEDAAYFHAQFRRINPLKYGDVYTILDDIEGEGQYVGTYLAWGLNNNAWWGEGEIKFYMDGDCNPKLSDGKEVAGSTGFPTICGTGTEDYFCGSYNFENSAKKMYQEFSTAYAGVPQVVRPDGLYKANTRFSMYRWHVTDPIRFTSDLKVTIQALGWRPDGRYLPLQDDISSVAFWYQKKSNKKFPPLLSPNDLEII